MKKLIETRIPFPGFYETILDEEMTRYFEELEGPNADFPREVMFFVAQHWAERWAEKLRIEAGLPDMILRFKSVTFPREYNFETNEIDAEIDLESLKSLLKLYKSDLQRLANKALMPRDGFIPFYDMHISSWGKVEDWEPPQTGLLLAAITDGRGQDLLGHNDWEIDEPGYQKAVEEGVSYAKEGLEQVT